jgi:hypothetical protein
VEVQSKSNRLLYTVDPAPLAGPRACLVAGMLAGGEESRSEVLGSEAVESAAGLASVIATSDAAASLAARTRAATSSAFRLA